MGQGFKVGLGAKVSHVDVERERAQVVRFYGLQKRHCRRGRREVERQRGQARANADVDFPLDHL